MQTITFMVQGSSAEPYEVIFIKDEASLFVTCTCKAWFLGQHCKHRIRILEGQPEGIISDNIAALPTVQAWLRGSNLARVLSSFSEAEAELERAKKRVTNAKKSLAIAMHP